MKALVKYQYQASSFLKHNGLEELSDVQQQHVNHFRETSNLSPHTIENYIKAVGILTETKFKGKPLRKPLKRPIIAALTDLDALYRFAKKRDDEWLMWFLKLSYITGLRHRDLVEMHRSSMQDDCIEVIAQKTGKLHIIPRHIILRGELPAGEQPLYANPKTVYKRLRNACESAGIKYLTPQTLRKTAANEYERAYPGAGGILLGHTLGEVTYRYYIDQTTVLERAQESLQVPDSMLPDSISSQNKMREEQLLNAFRRLPKSERESVLRLVSRSR